MNILEQIGAVSGCVSRPLQCISGGFDAWFQALPAEWLVLGALVAGMLLGASLGWRGVLGVLSLGALIAYLNRRASVPTEDQYERPDARKPSKPVPKARPKSLINRKPPA
jgi:hypothetical protein